MSTSGSNIYTCLMTMNTKMYCQKSLWNREDISQCLWSRKAFGNQIGKHPSSRQVKYSSMLTTSQAS